MDISSEVRRFGERVLTGTGLSLDEAAAVARGGSVSGVPEACVGALRDGWAVAQLDRDGRGEAVAS